MELLRRLRVGRRLREQSVFFREGYLGGVCKAFRSDLTQNRTDFPVLETLAGLDKEEDIVKFLPEYCLEMINLADSVNDDSSVQLWSAAFVRCWVEKFKHQSDVRAEGLKAASHLAYHLNPSEELSAFNCAIESPDAGNFFVNEAFNINPGVAVTAGRLGCVAFSTLIGSEPNLTVAQRLLMEQKAWVATKIVGIANRLARTRERAYAMDEGLIRYSSSFSSRLSFLNLDPDITQSIQVDEPSNGR